MPSTLIDTSNGPVQGITRKSLRVWRGIPFAKPPVGPLRFRAPQPVENWTTVRDATTFGSVPFQLKTLITTASFSSEPALSLPESDDCLTLNISAPADAGEKRPVMVWIYGGAYFGGFGAQYDGSRLAIEGSVVFVTFNYRLGPFGYMYFNDLEGDTHDFDSNLGTRDQIAALRWIHENIAAFGGDPGCVTIFGESAGGTSIGNLLGAPAASGLFHRAIAQSPASASVCDRRTATEIAGLYLSCLGLKEQEVAKLVTMPAERIIAAIRKFLLVNVESFTGEAAFSPVYGDDILPEHPFTAIANGSARGVPLIAGTNHDEATLFADVKKPTFPTTPALIHKMLARMNPDAEARVLAAYPGYPARSAVLAIARDAIFRIPAIRLAEAQSRHATTYVYRFDWSSPLLRLRGMNATHALEIPFVFDQIDSRTGKLLTNIAMRPPMRALSRRMRSAWLSFARSGSPGGSPAEEWPRYDPAGDRLTMIFNRRDRVTGDPDGDQRKAWDDVIR